MRYIERDLSIEGLNCYQLLHILQPFSWNTLGVDSLRKTDSVWKTQP